jgi:hypothetical protein
LCRCYPSDRAEEGGGNNISLHRVSFFRALPASGNKAQVLTRLGRRSAAAYERMAVEIQLMAREGRVRLASSARIAAHRLNLRPNFGFLFDAIQLKPAKVAAKHEPNDLISLHNGQVAAPTIFHHTKRVDHRGIRRNRSKRIRHHLIQSEVSSILPFRKDAVNGIPSREDTF